MIIIIYFFIIITIIYLCFCAKSLIKFFLPEKKIISTQQKKINELFLLGTHNSLTYRINNYFSQFAKTQNLNLELQLKYGVRFFDLRFKIIDNVLKGFHAFIDLHINHIEIFNIFLDFLKNNKNEFIIITLKNEEFQNHQLISQFLYNNYIVKNNLESYFLFNNSNWNYIPTIDEISNKIFILNHTKNPFENLPWGNDTDFLKGSIYISDKYKDKVDDKIVSYKKFLDKCSPNNINIFFSSLQFYNILGVRYINKTLLNRLKIDKNINQIFVADYIETIL